MKLSLETSLDQLVVHN